MFQNLDLNPQKFFINRDNDHLVTDIRDLRDKPLEKTIYYQTTYFPLIHYTNTDSCFQDYTIPTASYKFYKTNNGYDYINLEKTIKLHDYIDIVDNDIQDNIISIYQDNNEVTLGYSGGIDSVVLLSYIIKLGLLSRTNIVCFENLSQTDSSCLHLNSFKKFQVFKLLESIKSQCLSAMSTVIDYNDFVYCVNNLGFRHAQCYSTSQLLSRTRDMAYIFGHHGNQILLHKNIFVNEIVKHRPLAKEEFLNLPRDYYAQGMLNFVPSDDFPGIENTHMIMKPWADLDGYQGNRIYSPLGSRRTFESMRRLDYSDIPVEVIADAQVARQLINKNADFLAEYITTESVGEYDSFQFNRINISLQKLNPSILTIPSNLNHNAEGLAYLKNAVKSGIQSGLFKIDHVMSILALQWLASQ